MSPIPLPNIRRRLMLAPALALACGAEAMSAGPEDAPGDNTTRSERILGAGGLGLTVHEAGPAGARPIVFIHGFSQNSMTWDLQFADLAERFHLIAYDLRGHGASDKPLEPEKYTDAALWAEDLAAVLKARNVERPVLVGWSYGGYVIADYVRTYGDDALGGLVFLGAVTKNGTDEAASHLTDEVLGLFGDVLSPDVRSSINATGALTRLFAGETPEQWEIAFGSAMMVPPEVRLAMFSRRLENDDVLARIRVPTLVVHGSVDRLVRLLAAEHTASTIPGSRLLVYDGAGHAPHLEDAARFNRDLADFVRSLR